MKKFLSVLFAATMIFGMAANASANMGTHDFAMMTLDQTVGWETVDTLGPVWNGTWGDDPYLPAAGTTITDIFKLSDFVGVSSYSALNTAAVSNFEWISSDYSGQRAWIAIKKDATPSFDVNPGSYVTGYTNVYLYHTPESTPDVKGFGDAGEGLEYGGFSPLPYLGGFENTGNATVNLANILTEELLMDIWQVDWTTGGGNHVAWEKSGFDLKIYNSGGTTLGSEQIDATIMDASAVPIPGAVWLLVSGLLTVMGIRRRKL